MSCKADTTVHPVKEVDIAMHKAEVSHSPAPVPTHVSQGPCQAQSPQFVPLADAMAMLEKVLLHGASDQSQGRRPAPPRRTRLMVSPASHALFAKMMVTVPSLIAERRNYVSSATPWAIHAVTVHSRRLSRSSGKTDWSASRGGQCRSSK